MNVRVCVGRGGMWCVCVCVQSVCVLAHTRANIPGPTVQGCKAPTYLAAVHDNPTGYGTGGLE